MSFPHIWQKLFPIDERWTMAHVILLFIVWKPARSLDEPFFSSFAKEERKKFTIPQPHFIFFLILSTQDEENICYFNLDSIKTCFSSSPFLLWTHSRVPYTRFVFVVSHSLNEYMRENIVEWKIRRTDGEFLHVKWKCFEAFLFLFPSHSRSFTGWLPLFKIYSIKIGCCGIQMEVRENFKCNSLESSF